jgi:hypothetical protein
VKSCGGLLLALGGELLHGLPRNPLRDAALLDQPGGVRNPGARILAAA